MDEIVKNSITYNYHSADQSTGHIGSACSILHYLLPLITIRFKPEKNGKATS